MGDKPTSDRMKSKPRIGSEAARLYAGRMDGRMLKGDIARPKFRERTYEELKETYGKCVPSRYRYCQLKYDGIWGCLVISGGQWVIYSSPYASIGSLNTKPS